MSYILATHNHTGTIKWYVFESDNITPGSFTLIDKLDLSKVPNAGDKQTAKDWAKKLGLSTWRYVKI